MLYLGTIILILAGSFIYFLNKRSCEKYKRTLLDPTEMMMIIFSICLGAYSFSVSSYFRHFNIKTYILLGVILLLIWGVVSKGLKETDTLTGVTIFFLTIIIIPIGSYIVYHEEIFASATGLLIAFYFIIKTFFL